MRKRFVIVILMLLFVLTGCIEPSLDKLTIELNPSVDTIEINSTYQDPGVKAFYGFVELTAKITSNTLDITQLGTYEIVYAATYKSLEKTIKRIITVVDETPPVITLNPGVDTIVLGGYWEDAFVSVTDNSNDDIDVSIIGEVNTQIAGIYIIVYVATDASGNESRISRYIEVIDPNLI